MTTKAKKSTNVTGLIADFQRDNRGLLEAMKLFEVSNAEYQRALSALAPPATVTATSTDVVQEAERDAVVD